MSDSMSRPMRGQDGVLGRVRPVVAAVGHEVPQPLQSMAEAADQKARQARAVVPLAVLMRPFFMAAEAVGSVMGMLWRMILRILRRIAGANHVELDAPPGEQPAHRADSAAFVGDSEPAGAAAEKAGEDLRAAGEFATQLEQSNPDYKQALQGQGAKAYLQMALQRLGSELVVAKQARAEHDEGLRAAVAPVAERLGVPADELAALLKRSSLDQATLSMDADLPALREQALLGKDVADRIESLKEQFVDHCAAAVDPAIGDPEGEIAAIVSAVLQTVGDAQLSELVGRAMAQEVRQATAQQEDAPANKAAGEPAPVSQARRTRRFSDIDVGDTVALDEAPRASQPRMGLPSVPLAQSELVDLDVPLATATQHVRERAT